MLYVQLQHAKLFEKMINSGPKDVARAMKAAAKRAAYAGQDEYKKGIGDVSYLKRDVINKAVKKPVMTQNSSHKVEYDVMVNGDVVGLDRFKVRPKRVTAQKGVWSVYWKSPEYKIGPGEDWHTLKRNNRASAGFLAKTQSYSKLMFYRRFGKWKVARAYGYTPQYFAAFDELADRRVTHRIEETFNKRFEHELFYYLGKKELHW